MYNVLCINHCIDVVIVCIDVVIVVIDTPFKRRLQCNCCILTFKDATLKGRHLECY